MPNKRRIAAAILCACFVFRLTAYAVPRDGLYFVAVENMMAPLTEDTMPFWHDAYLYISADIFTGNIRDALGVSRAKIGDGVLLYRGEQSLLFREGYPYAQDSREETYAPGMVWRDGGAYVPASVVARYFKLTYSIVSVKYGQLVWLRSAAFKMDDKAFAKAAEFQMNAAYQEYLRSLEPEEEPEPPPEWEAETPSEEEAPEASGEWEALPEPDPEGAEREAESLTPSESADPDATTTPAAPSSPTTTTPAAPSAPATTKPAAPSTPATTTPVTPSTPTTTTPAAPSTPATTKPVTPSTPATTPAAPSTPATTTPAPTTTTPVTPPDPAPTVTEPVPPEIGGGQNIYLCLRGGDATSASLDALDRHDIRAAVFCDETFLSEQGDLLRRMAATGYPIGLYVPSGDSASVLARLEACNEQLRRVTMEKTRLVCADGAGETLLRALRGAGYICIRPALDRSEFPLRTSRQASELLTAAAGQSESVIIWLGGAVSRSGLNAFVNDALEVGDAFPAPNEAVFF